MVSAARDARRRWGALAALGALGATLLAGCGGAPEYRFVASSGRDLVVRVPWAWTSVKDGTPTASDGTAMPSGSWVGIWDAATRPTENHLRSFGLASPVALAQTIVLPAGRGASITDDQLRDFAFPVSQSGRTAAGVGSAPGSPTFTLMKDVTIQTGQSHGVHTVFSYDFGTSGVEVFDQIALLDKKRTRVHVFLAHCSKACYQRFSTQIDTAASSMTVRVP